ncbi:UDP-N-acetylmuramoyl-L-alanine--D-glutamate ligase [Candidatus Falkowbacteria bacterium]|nr:UDP-N-acetylmuramoyl-L-alanine--D-glutamate ligase [Candidatus Falkowbacteria bacterium]
MNYELRKLKNKKIAMLGLGMENYALVKYLLKKKIKCEITICDARSKEELEERFKKLEKRASWKLGKNYDKNLSRYDIIFRSPGYPPHFLKAKSYKLKADLSSPMKLFFNLCPTKNIIGVTGTKGKGTTATLIYEILKKAEKRVWLGGNIGVAPFEFLDKIKKNDWVVLELSSFQLENMDVSPCIAVITNFYKEHLSPADPNNPNYHKTIADYWKAKTNIFKWQGRGDYIIVNSKFKIPNKPPFTPPFKGGRGRFIYFTKSELPSKLIGEHNKENIAAAVAVAKIVGVKDKIIKKAVAGFKGLEHRLELAKTIKVPLDKGGQGGFIHFYNDSFATTPESAITALRSFNAPIILLAGGADKGANFKNLAREIYPGKYSGGAVFTRVKNVMLLNGKATLRIKKELLKIKYPQDKIKLVFSMKEAVREAKRNAIAGDVVLLSPACASFGMFRNYKERGKLFKKEVLK